MTEMVTKAMKTAMIVADCFLKQLDPTPTSRSRKTKNDDVDSQAMKCIDIWTIRPSTSHRGGMITTCYRGINRHHTESIIRQQLSSSSLSSSKST
jgi:hypothetical protein